MLVAAGLALVGIAAVAVVPMLGTSVLPTFADRNVLVRLEGQSRRLEPVDDCEDDRGRRPALRTLPGVATVGGQVGRAVTGDRVVNVSSSDIWVTVESDADYDETLAGINGVVNEVADVTAEVSPR